MQFICTIASRRYLTVGGVVSTLVVVTVILTLVTALSGLAANREDAQKCSLPHTGGFMYFMRCFAFSASTLLVGRQEEHPACKN